MRFSVLLNAEHEARTLMDLARRIERLGFDTLWYADERFYREAYAGLAICALATERIKLGTGVTDPYTRHPALTAMAIGTIDELSNGRALLGIGAGRAGYHNIGIELVRPVRRLREGIEIVKRLLAGEHLDYRGEIFQTDDLWLKFPTRPDIPIYLAADGPHILRLAGEVADAVITSHCASPAILREKLRHVREGAARVGRSTGPEVVPRLDVSNSHHREAALEQAKLRLGRYLWIRYPNIEYLETHGLSLPAELDRRLREAGPPDRTHDLRAFERFAEVTPDELVYPIKLAGTPADVREQIQAVREAGADEIMAYPLVPRGETAASVLDLFAEATGRRKD
jgi:5,10-methylenetetrahydromethanopterin reductase